MSNSKFVWNVGDLVKQEPKPKRKDIVRITHLKGGPGSGHRGHRGIPGKRGGSLPGVGGGIALDFGKGSEGYTRAGTVEIDGKKFTKLEHEGGRRLDTVFLSEDGKVHGQVIGGKPNPIPVPNQPKILEPTSNDVFESAFSKADYTASDREGWFGKVPANERAISSISDKSGAAEEDVARVLDQWSYTTNGRVMAGLSLQEAAAEEFGTKVSRFQQQQIDYVRSGRPVWTPEGISLPLSKNIPLLPRTQERKVLRTMYEDTQGWLRSRGIGPDDKITLHRGYIDSSGRVSSGNTSYKGNPMEAWTFSKSVARRYARDEQGTAAGIGVTGKGYVLSRDFLAKDLLSIPHTGFGSLAQDEVVVLRSSEGISVYAE